MNKKFNPSTFPVALNTAIQACQQAINEVAAERQRLLKIEVTQAMLPRKVGIWPWRKTTTRTHQEAEAYVKDRDDGHWADWQSIWYADLDKAKTMAKALLAVSDGQNADEEDTLSLSLEDANFIGRYTR